MHIGCSVPGRGETGHRQALVCPSWDRHCLAAPDPALRLPSLFSNQVIKLSGVHFVVHVSFIAPSIRLGFCSYGGLVFQAQRNLSSTFPSKESDHGVPYFLLLL